MVKVESVFRVFCISFHSFAQKIVRHALIGAVFVSPAASLGFTSFPRGVSQSWVQKNKNKIKRETKEREARKDFMKKDARDVR